jgi:hypothetical protein
MFPVAPSNAALAPALLIDGAYFGDFMFVKHLMTFQRTAKSASPGGKVTTCSGYVQEYHPGIDMVRMPAESVSRVPSREIDSTDQQVAAAITQVHGEKYVAPGTRARR